MRNSIQRQVKDYIEKEHLFNRGDTILVGISGGADSVALLHLLCKLRSVYGWTLIAVHFNHQLRQGATADERFVSELCKHWLVTLYTKRLIIKSPQDKGSIEQLAREKRLSEFKKLLKKYKADCIALGHHKDDLAETVLLHILRGSGLQGMQGLLPKRQVGPLHLRRPLLDLTKKDLLDYCQENSLTFRTDPSNSNRKFLRNKIRHELIPFLSQNFQPQITNRLADLASNTSDDYAFLLNVAEKAFRRISQPSKESSTASLNLNQFARLHPSIKRLVLRICIRSLTGDMNAISAGHISELMTLIDSPKKNLELHLPKAITVRKTTKFLRLKRKA